MTRPTASPNAPTYKSVLLGSGETSVTVRLPTFPPSDADPVLKKVALRTAIASLQPHLNDVSSRCMLDAFDDVVPLDLQAIDHECSNLSDSIRDAFLRPGHPAVTHTATGFYNFKGTTLSVSMNLKAREKAAKTNSGHHCIKFVGVSATATDLSSIHKSLAAVGQLTAYYTLQLPQTSAPVSAAAVAAGETALDLGGETSDEDEATPGATATPSVPASMRGCLSPTAVTSFPNFYGNFTFLDSLAEFSKVFPENRPPVVDLPTNGGTSVSYPSYAECIPAITRACYFACFTSLLELDYVGVTISNDAATQAIFHMLRSLTATRHNQATRKSTYHTPTDMFQSFMSFAPTLDSSTAAAISSWPGSLAQQFLTNLGTDIQQDLYKGRSAYTPTDHSKLPTLSLQLSELRKLATAAQEIYDDHKRLHTMCSRSLGTRVDAYLQTQSPLPQPMPPRPSGGPPAAPTPTSSSTPVTPPTVPALLSPAEQAMQSYAPSADDDCPIDPYSDSKYQSKYPRSFKGCYRCGLPHRRLADGTHEVCPKRADESTKARFFQEYFAHCPDKRRYYDNGVEVERDPHGKIIYPCRTTPSTDLTIYTRPPKIARQLVQLLRSLHIRPATTLRPIPVAITSCLPTIDLRLGTATDPPSPTVLTVLLDTCAGLNSGSYVFHKALADIYPNCVADFVEFDNDLNPFEPVRLTGAITDPSDYDPASLHGSLRAVITYHLPYTFVDGSPVKLSIALGTEVSVNTIVGWPFVASVRGLIDCGSNTFLARDLGNTSFSITPAVPLLTDSIPTHTTLPSRRIDNRPAWQSHPPTPHPLPTLPPPPPPQPTTGPPPPPIPPPTTATLHAAASAAPESLQWFLSQHQQDFCDAPR